MARPRDWPDMAALGALVGDRTRARMLDALMEGRALTATELALRGDVATSTASAHLAKLTRARILKAFQQGRHRYFHLFDDEVAAALEGLMTLAARETRPAHRGRAGPALAAARVCYDHLAGARGVWLADQLVAGGRLAGRDAWTVTAEGRSSFTGWGIDMAALEAGRRPVCRTCLDWSERRFHLGGALGAAVLQRLFALRWARREPGSRAVTFTANGERSLRGLLVARGGGLQYSRG